MASSEAEAEAETPGAAARTRPPNPRVAEVIVTMRDGEEKRGSGYLVTQGRVMTCWHVVQDASSIDVRFNAGWQQDERTFEAVARWHHEDIDVAVLIVDSQEEVPPKSFARIGEQTSRLECEAKGFPLFKWRPHGESRFRNLDHLQATCAPLANSRDRTLELRVHDPPDPYADPREPHERDGEYSPWEGMSGAVVFSGGRIIGVVTRHYPAEGGRLTASRVDSWQDLIPHEKLLSLESWLNCSLARDYLADAAEGPRRLPDGVRTHQQELANGRNQDKFLTGSQVTFVSPGDEHKADPKKLLERLSALSAPGSRADDLGVVLIGAAGSGKTRTCFEVAEKAAKQGWTVLHVGRDATVPAEELADAVGALHSAGQDVLLVLDYLDHCTQLDADFTSKVEERRSSQARLACIASLRPGARQNAKDREQLHLFEEVEVCQEESHQEAVTRGIVGEAAREAVKAHGLAAVAKVCGTRPVLALLIARAIEYRFRNGERDVVRQAGLRNDRRLSFWLSRRTREDFEDARTLLLASAVAAAACPQQRTPVEDAVAAFLERHEDRDFADDEVGVVGHLTKLKWILESDDGELDVMHDFVVDELLQQALLLDGLRLQGATAATMFSAFLVSVPTFRRAANHVRRWSTDLGQETRRDVQRVCGNWLRRKAGAAELAERLAAENDLTESGRALLALLSGPPWQAGAVEAWDELVAPWLARVADKAPHLTHWFFARAVSNTSDAVPERLSSAAVEWVKKNPDRPREIRKVLEALLRAAAVGAEHRSEAARLAVQWLGNHGTVWGNRALALAETLLKRKDLPEDIVEQAVSNGISVAESHLPARTTAYLLDALLGRTGLEPGPREAVLKLAFTWLRRHPDADSASFVLVPLLRSADLERSRQLSVVDRSLNWLAGRPALPVAAFVLRPLLKHGALNGKPLESAGSIAMEWLKKHGAEHDATFVLPGLLLRAGHGQNPENLAGLALDWLETHHPFEDAHFVIRAVLEQPRLPEDGPERIARFASAWLDTDGHGATEQAKSVLGALLSCRGLPGGDDHCAAATRWLGVDANLRSEEASFVLAPLLQHPALGQHMEDVGGLALDWLKAHPGSENASYVLGPLLSVNGFHGDRGTAGEKAEADPVGFAFNWLDGNGTSVVARFVLGPLLHPGRAGAQAAPQALTWLGAGDNGTLAEASFVLRPLLKCPGLDEDFTAKAVGHALDWLDEHHPGLPETVPWVVGALSRCVLPDGEALRGRAVERILDCVADGHVDLSKKDLQALCRLGPLPYELGTRLAQLTMESVGARPSVDNVKRLAAPLWRDDILPEQVNSLVDLTLELLDEDRYLKSAGGMLLRALLSRTDLDRGRHGDAVAKALEWLGPHGHRPFAGALLAPLLRVRDHRGDGGHGSESVRLPDGGDPLPDAEALLPDGVDLVAMALSWLEAHPAHPYTPGVLSALLERPDLTPSQTDACTTQAAEWSTAARSSAQGTDEEGARRLKEQLSRRQIRTGEATGTAGRPATDEGAGSEPGWTGSPVSGHTDGR